MTKYIELIDKYEIRQSDLDEYNPPSYIWRDNTGELIRCKDCKWFGDIGCAISIADDTDKPSENDYCSFAERKENDTDRMDNQP